MNGIWAVTTIASILILASFGFSQEVYAPPEKPEKIKVGPINWDTDSQAFEVDFAIHFGPSKASEQANFVISTTLVIVDNAGSTADVLRVSSKVKDVIKEAGTRTQTDSIPGTQEISWERNGGTFNGVATVTATIQILTPSGHQPWGSSSATVQTEVG